MRPACDSHPTHPLDSMYYIVFNRFTLYLMKWSNIFPSVDDRTALQLQESNNTIMDEIPYTFMLLIDGVGGCLSVTWEDRDLSCMERN